jgi:4-hydroxythreonine-4-phosphate dehydrogenase
MLADDFTGACDTGLQFVRSGLRCAVVVDPAYAADRSLSTDVLVLDTETRNCTRPEAERRLRAACDGIAGLSARLFYKKVDSALRGNLATEIRAVMLGLGMDLCLVAPAFPEAGRVTVGGYHLVHGVPVERTEVGHDPGSPVRGSYLPHLLDQEQYFAVRTIGLEEISEGPDQVVATVEGVRGAGPTVIVLDAASAEDLQCIASAAAMLPAPPLLCGSAGLAAQVAGAFELDGKPWPVRRGSRQAGPVLLVVGSAESATRAQVEALRHHRGTAEWEVHVDATAHAWERPHLSTVVDEIVGRLSDGHDAALSLVGLREGMSPGEVEEALRALGEAVRRIFDRVRPAGVVATGGWTALETLRALGGEGAEIVGGVAEGVPLSRMDGGPFDGLRMVTKGGALGEEGALVDAVDRLGKPQAGDEAEPLPLLAITMGDACGIGPEVIVKALGHPEVYRICRPVVIGHPDILKANLALGGGTLEVETLGSPDSGAGSPGTIDVWSPVDADLSQIEVGKVCAEAGRLAGSWVMEAVDLAMDGRIGGIVTAPLNKEALNLAGFAYAGHTEMLAERTGGRDVRLMLASERLNVVHATGHVAIRDVPGRLTRRRVYDTIALIHGALENMGYANPRIAVCGLNPHAGEAGLFGDEDAGAILPAVEEAAAAGWEVTGPLPPDTVFFRSYNGDFDGVVAMYHDQGHTAVKLVAFEDAVNVTLGLPIVRTSVDHGTAFDIAGKGVADEKNLLQAIRLGARLARARARDSVGSG